jgi:hypothetical protein
MTTFRLFVLVLAVLLLSLAMIVLAYHLSNPSWYLLFTILCLAGGIFVLRRSK